MDHALKHRVRVFCATVRIFRFLKFIIRTSVIWNIFVFPIKLLQCEYSVSCTVLRMWTNAVHGEVVQFIWNRSLTSPICWLHFHWILICLFSSVICVFSSVIFPSSDRQCPPCSKFLQHDTRIRSEWLCVYLELAQCGTTLKPWNVHVSNCMDAMCIVWHGIYVYIYIYVKPPPSPGPKILNPYPKP